MVVVVSAMGETTDELIDLARRVTREDPTAAPHVLPEREMDLLLSTGEIVSCTLLSMALHSMGVPAMSFTGHQAGIETDTAHGRARILRVEPRRIRRALEAGSVVVVAGFQGITPEIDITTLGRGGSDTTAVALAAALHARCCEIYTDVDGVYTADPRVEPRARKLVEIGYEEMLELASQGALFDALAAAHLSVDAIVQNSSVEKLADLSFTVAEADLPKALSVIRPVLDEIGAAGVVTEEHVGKVSIVGTGVLSAPGYVSRMFRALQDAGINIELITTSEIRITCIIDGARVPDAVRALHAAFELETPSETELAGGA
jgi:aspartate kinase